ncbi:MAG TPA: efflux RND transporter periplasmic adaptor subunit [Stellaceae bacterium]|nr:efflux RND transporter periplasmic adaptor subunit [Stellaceae bacterium]
MPGRVHQRRLTAAIAGALFAALPLLTAAAQNPAPPGGGVGALGRVEPQSGLIEVGAGPANWLLGLQVKVGDKVKKGQVLAYLDTYPIEAAARDEAAARLAEAQARLKAQNELSQAQTDQADKKGDQQARIAKANADLARAGIAIDSLSKAVAVANARLAAATVTAPIDGTILAIQLHPGETIGARPILTMGDVTKMAVRAEVYETDIPRVKIGQSATMSSGALPKPLTGHVVEIGRMVSRNSIFSTDPTARVDGRVVPVRIDIDDPSPVTELSNLTVDVVIAAPPAAKPAPAQAAGK